jgi:hypothetical protein
MANIQEQQKKDEVSAETNTLIDSNITLVSPSMSRYNYAKDIKGDFNKDGKEDKIVLLADAERDDKGRHIWSHSHIWQAYLQLKEEVKFLYAQHINSGHLVVHYDSTENKIYLQEIGPYKKNIYLVDSEKDFSISVVDNVPTNSTVLSLIDE